MFVNVPMQAQDLSPWMSSGPLGVEALRLPFEELDEEALLRFLRSGLRDLRHELQVGWNRARLQIRAVDAEDFAGVEPRGVLGDDRCHLVLLPGSSGGGLDAIH